MLLLNHLIVNPALPFVCKILNELYPGNMIVINGSSPPSAKNFVINLALGDNYVEDSPDRSAIAFHFNPRFNQNYVALNTYESRWGSEESNIPNAIFPFTINKSFEIMILVTADSYIVTVDQKHFISYKHRIPYQRVNTLHILRDINVERILLSDGPSISFMPNIKQEMPANVTHNLVVPFETTIPTVPMRPGNTICLSTRPIKGANTFKIGLSVSGKYGRAGDIALQIIIYPQQLTVGCNCRINGSWGLQERNNLRFLFKEIVNFDIKIICEIDNFSVFVNDQHFLIYHHRLPYYQIDRFGIEGDIYVRSLKFT